MGRKGWNERKRKRNESMIELRQKLYFRTKKKTEILLSYDESHYRSVISVKTH